MPDARRSGDYHAHKLNDFQQRGLIGEIVAKKVITFLAIILLCAAILTVIYTLTRNNHVEAPNLPQNTIAASSTPTGNNDTGNKTAGTVYFDIMYERNTSFLGLKFDKQIWLTNANVSIYEMDKNNLSYRHLLDIPGNPASSASVNIPGHGGTYYKFENVPYGDYYVIAEKGDNRVETVIILNAASDGTIFGVKLLNPDPWLEDK